VPYPFPSDIAQRVRALVESGHFGTEDDVLREAIDTLEKRQRGLAHLRQMVQEAEADIAAGRVGPFDADETKATVRARLETRGIDN
jgi:putative addiction module CopG family antidote